MKKSTYILTIIGGIPATYMMFILVINLLRRVGVYENDLVGFSLMIMIIVVFGIYMLCDNYIPEK